MLFSGRKPTSRARVAIGSESSVTSPAPRAVTPARARSKVVFPEPLGPITATSSPVRSEKLAGPRSRFCAVTTSRAEPTSTDAEAPCRGLATVTHQFLPTHPSDHPSRAIPARSP